jgi:hypothetical protein
MLHDLLDAHYGGQAHHIGDGDGIPENRAIVLREWWKHEQHLQHSVDDACLQPLPNDTTIRFCVPNDTTIRFCAPNDTTIRFCVGGKEVGCFDFGASPITFTGDADQSAQLFIAAIRHHLSK